MDMDTVVAAAKWCRDNDEQFFIGGGEPTLHPRFWDIVAVVLRYNSRWAANAGVQPIQLVTNGSQTETALMLAEMAEAGAAYVRLSRDQFHRPWHIDERVIKAFNGRNGRDEKDGRDTNDDIINVIPVGRARRSGWTRQRFNPGKRGCDACGAMITPDGTFWRCSCRKEKLGHISTGCKCDTEVLLEPGCTVDDGKLVADRFGWLWRRDKDADALAADTVETMAEEGSDRS